MEMSIDMNPKICNNNINCFGNNNNNNNNNNGIVYTWSISDTHYVINRQLCVHLSCYMSTFVMSQNVLY